MACHRVETGPQILELQPAGKKRMTAAEFLRGYPLTDGHRFGPEHLHDPGPRRRRRCPVRRPHGQRLGRRAGR
ncbi:MAG: hypothetical protein U0871_08165 [Gemmataceae bacterium]